MKIEINKQYRTKEGDHIKILHILEKPDINGKSVIALYNNKVLMYYLDGMLTVVESTYDLVEVSPYDDWKIDDPIFVSDSITSWRRGHFAGVTDDGRPTMWSSGRTSWVAPVYDRLIYDHARKPTEREMKGEQ